MSSHNPQQEEASSQEGNIMISTFPKYKGWISSDMCHYQTFWFPGHVIQGVINCQKHFDARDSDVFLVTTPKSGTTWLKAIMFALLSRKRHLVAQNHPLLAQNPHDLVPFLEVDLYARNENPDLASYPSPRLFSTHMPYISLPECVKNGSTCKIVYLCRNPKDIFVSLSHFTNSLKPQEKGQNSVGGVFEMFCKGVSAYGPVWDHILSYWKQSEEDPERVLFLKYEDMKEQPGMHLRRLAGFLGCPISPEEEESGQVDKILNLCSFDSLRSLEINRNGKTPLGVENKYFFRKGEVGDWKNHLSPEMVEKLDQITNEKFSGSGLVL